MTRILYHVYALINFVEKRKLVNWNNKIIFLSWIHPLSHLWHQWTFGYFNVYWKIKKNTLNAQIHHNCHYKTCDGAMFVKTRVVFKLLNHVRNPHLPTKELLISCGKGKKEILAWIMGKHLSFLPYPNMFFLFLFSFGLGGGVKVGGFDYLPTYLMCLLTCLPRLLTHLDNSLT